MTQSRSRIIAVCVLLSGVVSWWGCSIIGLSAGVAESDHRVTPWKLVGVRPGRTIDIRLRDDTRVHGTFRGLVDVPQDEYRVAYEEARSALLSEKVQLPALGPVTVTWSDAKSSTANLVGLVPSALVLIGSDGEPRVRSIAKLSSITETNGASVSRATLERLMEAGRLPYVKAIEVLGFRYSGKVRPEDPAYEIDRVGFAEVATVKLEGRFSPVTGFLVGAAIDGLLFAVAASTISISPDFDSGGSSCPYVYSYDGEGFVLDAEPLAGAIMPAVARAEVSRLDRLRASGGAYRLRVVNELREVEHIDEVSLIAVDHRPGVEVVPDFAGGLHLLSKAEPPRTAVDQRGIVVTSLMASAEGESWESNPFQRDPDAPADRRDALVAEFVRRPGSSEVRLAIEARSTPWVVDVLHDFLAAQGPDVDAWYALVSAEPHLDTYRSLASRLVPELEVWTGTQWRRVGSLGPLPTAKSTIRVLRVSLRGLPEDVLRVRVVGLPGAWAIDRMVADFGPGEAAHGQELVVRSAAPSAFGGDTTAATLGGDTLELLSTADGESLTLWTGDSVELSFVAPPLSPGLARTLLLRTKGWYHILLDPARSAEPRAGVARVEEIDRRSLERLREVVAH